MKNKIATEVILATTVCILAVMLLYRLHDGVGPLQQIGIMGIPLIFVYLPLFLGRIGKFTATEIGFTIVDYKKDFLLTVKVAAVVLPLFVIIHYFFWNLTSGKPFVLHLEKSLIPLVIWNLVGVSFPEEVFFRGYLQTRLAKVMEKRIKLLGTDIGLAVIVTSAVFALAHLIKGFDFRYLAVFFPSLLFGWVRERTNTILAPSLLHWLSNLTLFLFNGNA